MRQSLIILPLMTLLLAAASARADVVQQSGVQGGFVAHVGCADPTLTVALKKGDAYVVHALDADAAKARQAREAFLAARLSGTVSAATFDGGNLPYADNLVNLLVVSSRFELTEAELMRVLAPGGVLMEQAGGEWEKTVKPVPAEMDDWPHYLHSPDNNAVSSDTAITAPLGHLQWKAGPRYSRHHDKASSVPAVVSSGGRLFAIIDEGPQASILWDSDWKLIARDAFNGVLLWKRDINQWTDQLWPLKSGPANTPRRLVAQGSAVYVTLGLLDSVSKLDAATGQDVRVYEGTEKAEEIVLQGGVLYLVVNPTCDPAKRGGVWQRAPKKIMAVRESDGDILWQRELPWIAPLSLTVADDNLYLCDGPRILAFEKGHGKELWRSQELPWRERMPTYFGPTLVAVGDDCLLYAGGENWREHAGSKGLLTCLEADTGKIRWQQPHLPSGYQSPQDIFVIGGTAWCGSLNSKPGEFDKRYPDVAPSTGDFIGYDIQTGKLSRTIPRGADCYWFHHRCYRARATENYFLTSRTGVEMIDIESGKWDLHHWTRGACLYGIMPANGLIYTPPHPCACYPEAKLSGFNALAGLPPSRGPAPKDADRLEQGPAFEAAQRQKETGRSPADWPTYRGNPARSGSTTVAVNADVTVKWKARFGGSSNSPGPTKLSQPVVAGDTLFVAAVDDHAVYALDRETGEVQWRFIAGGRVDSPPTIYRDLAIFGCRDGYVYCLRASDGRLVWRFQAAPSDRRTMVWDQLESLWPVHGSVLIRNGVAYVLAGRHMFLDGGLTLYRLNPLTGRVLSKVAMDGKDPNTGKDLHAHVRVPEGSMRGSTTAGLSSLPVASADILSSEGDYLFMRSQPFDRQGNRLRIAQLDVNSQRGDDAHLFVPNGFLDDAYWHRAFWVYGRSVAGGPGYSATGKATPAGKIMVLDDENVYVFGRQPQYWRWTTPTEYCLHCAPRTGGNRARWNVQLPILARAMVKAGDTLFACGPEDIIPEQQFAGRKQPDQLEELRRQAAIYAGREGAILCAVSAVDGEKLHRIKLDVLPVFDGMMAAHGNLYMSTVDGEVACFGAK